MPKMKTNSGAKKRFTMTATGKLKRKHAYKSHLLTKKTKKRKKRLTKVSMMNTSDARRMRQLLAK
ncbi:MAG: 50S ribosomal protein L35 [Bacteroidales bacterium]|nr:50S ribosomal protein L35 [Bacteroidales bacterium]MCF8334513.1 50S ribosomal protein L35 [Bacteroidales bacterium]